MFPQLGWRQWLNSPERLGILKKVWIVLVTLGAVAIFLYQVSFNLAVFLKQPTVFMVSLEPNPAFQMPPFSVCPYPAYDPAKLRNLGIRKTKDYLAFEEYYLALEGVSENVTTGQLYEEAGWDFGDLILYVFLDKVSHTYEPFAPMPSIWKQSYSPLGPCRTLHTPVGVSEVVVNLNTWSIVRQCKFLDDDGKLTRYGGTPTYCSEVEAQCNSSCGLEDFVYFGLSGFDSYYIYFHGTPVEAEDGDKDILEYSNKLFDGNYVLKQLFSTPNLISKPQLIDSSILKGSCIPDESYSPGECFRNQLSEETFKYFACSPVLPSNFGNSSKHDCRTPTQMKSLASNELLLKNQCLRKCKRLKWNHKIDNVFASESFTVILYAPSTDIRREEEVETYPMAQLFSDTGGSLGLFLGVSILTFWELLLVGVKYCFTARRGIVTDSTKSTIMALAKYGGILLLAIATCTHCWETVRTYLTQPRLTAVSLRVPELAGSEESIEILVARRLAMQALNCRLQETGHEECQVTCVLEEAAIEMASIVPFVRVEGLPLCKDSGLSIPSYVYVVPSEMLLAATIQERVEKCHKICENFPFLNYSELQSHTFQMIVDSNHYGFDALQLVCSIGGIIGLYLGYSIFDAFDLSNSIVASQNHLKSYNLTTKHIFRFHQILKVAICVIGVVLALSQLHTFLIHHKMSVSTNQEVMANSSEELAVTVCRWPPLSLRHLAKQLNLNISEKILHKLPKDQRLPEVLRVLETLPGNWSVSLDEIWQHAAWNISDVIEGFLTLLKNRRTFTGFCAYSELCQTMWKPVLVSLNRCFSLNMNVHNSTVLDLILIFPEYLEKKSILGESPQIYLTVNQASHTPLMTDMVAKTAYRRIYVNYNSAAYRRLNQQQGNVEEHQQATTNNSFCVHKCLAEGASRHLNCRLPYVTWRPDLPPCNQEQYQTIPAFFKGLEGIGKGWNKLKNSENASESLLSLYDKCYIDCHHLKTKFSALTVDDTNYDAYPTITVSMKQEGDLEIIEEDRYTVSQLLSDLGGIAGSTAGFSLLFLLKEVVLKLVTGQYQHK